MTPPESRPGLFRLDPADFDALTFDVYGTIVDWDAGIVAALRPVLSAHGVAADLDVERLLSAYAEEEAACEDGPYLRYREILQRILERLGARFGFKPSRDEVERFGGSVADWVPFEDSAPALAALKRSFKLAFLTNCDDDLIAATIAKLGVAPDWVVTAQQVGSYKPNPRHFLAAFERMGLPRERILHVAQSLYHDHVPAKKLGLRTVWVNRRGEAQVGVEPDFEVRDLATLARMLA